MEVPLKLGTSVVMYCTLSPASSSLFLSELSWVEQQTHTQPDDGANFGWDCFPRRIIQQGVQQSSKKLHFWLFLVLPGEKVKLVFPGGEIREIQDIFASNPRPGTSH